MTTQRRIDLDVQQQIEELALQGRFAAQIHRELDRHEEYRGRVPTLRTVQRVVKEITPRDPSGVWSLSGSPDIDATLVMPVLAEVIERTEGERKHLTRSEAGWIAKIREVAPALDLWHCYMLAVAYVRATEMKASAEGLDAFVAYAPWSGKASSDRYVEAVNNGWAPPPWPYIGALRSADGSVSDAFANMAADQSVKLELFEGETVFSYREAET